MQSEHRRAILTVLLSDLPVRHGQIPVDEGELAHPESPTLPSPTKGSATKTSTTSSAAASEDAKSSASSSEELEDDAIPDCPDPHEEMKLYLDRSFAMDIDHMFTCMFTGR